ncbi:hypothetical protein AUEXF2481DRAFT_342344 [Aureobasidium subglaciale EXF-2481]|uniref:Uncharacterized protein n=1 Tax=Aureobasidium subglaciale (strain EXF-2481) TaxID=1043005 RepID=A0A074Y6Q9_AURSE|nr:uncharacterized protein AUEXF2481DRAFT_342344 [Aureobasidium subglaciale EXF-2481]KAI5199662.1 hypothetical protein E4T38_06922 [Aureobasidium subglaciale]KAI5218547.1 hypothetical protein E4T40_06853 [Aureobasidium subglaciale]KAI5222134.1 hypothetical protein E4T41_06773 [Aureobasidium subglaciale]KAI5259664.1 hypothetical protein E4T46_06751 [Aureobasidium subglaciale]KEQ93395.1 hypothetical protein AUEXF2481DRAFT_342344 [Aureobasidium subglaciale EXF-2481]
MSLFCRPPSSLLSCLATAGSHPSVVTSFQHHVPGNALLKARFGLRSASHAPAKLLYPRRLQIYHSPTVETALLGTMKLSGLGLFAMTCLVVAPNVYFEESNPLWLTPAVIAVGASALPLLHLLTRPAVVNIFIDTPVWARRSKESLMMFAKRLPPDTAMEIETLGLLPLPRTKVLRLSELRICPAGWGRLANLEQVTAVDQTSKVPKLLRWSLQRFYARPAASRWKNSRAPDVWPLVFQTISSNTIASLTKKGTSPSASPVRPAQALPRVMRKKVPTPVATPANKQPMRKK